jgi:halimadienyl-diphosphate synthase
VNWLGELRNLLSNIGTASIAPTAYDTAWAARVPHQADPDRPAFPEALDWLLAHQHADGSWGTRLNYHADRVLSTLAAALTLAYWKDRCGGNGAWSHRLEAAQRSIWQNLAGLQRDPYDPIGFELILPTLLNEARRRGFALPYASFDSIARLRDAKLRQIPAGLVYTRRVSTIFSAEFLGDELDVQRVIDLQDANGSIASSPSATAYFLLKDSQNASARAYLSRALASGGGAAPAVDPIDVFEPAWVLLNVALVCPDAAGLSSVIEPHVDTLVNEIGRKNGAGYNSYFAVPDLDGTATVFRVLAWAGIALDPALLAQFEEDDHFRCFPYERNPSVSAHIHLLDALRVAPAFPDRARLIRKARDFLARSRTLQTFWFDKWHASPYYTTAHAVIALGEDRSLAEDAVFWIVNTQQADGSWGYYNRGTAEETAYCIQALAIYRRNGGVVDGCALQRGADYLWTSAERINLDYTPLWIGKSLYAPTWVAHATVLSALALAGSA